MTRLPLRRGVRGACLSVGLAASFAALPSAAFALPSAWVGDGSLPPIPSFTLEGRSGDALQLSWVEVPGLGAVDHEFEVYLNGNRVSSPQWYSKDGSRGVLLRNLQPQTEYQVELLARSPGHTTPVKALNATTAAAGVDGIAPSFEGGQLQPYGKAARVSWNELTDDNGVQSIELLLDGTVIKTLGAGETSTFLRGRDYATTDRYAIRGVDAAGNKGVPGRVFVQPAAPYTTVKPYTCTVPGLGTFPVEFTFDHDLKGPVLSGWDGGLGRYDYRHVVGSATLGTAFASALTAIGAASFDAAAYGSVRFDFTGANAYEMGIRGNYERRSLASPEGDPTTWFAYENLSVDGFAPPNQGGTHADVSSAEMGFAMRTFDADGAVQTTPLHPGGEPNTRYVDCVVDGPDAAFASYEPVSAFGPGAEHRLSRPSDFAVTGRSDTAVALRWNDGESFPESDVIEVLRDGVKIKELSSKDKAVIVRGLEASTTYELSIVRRDADGIRRSLPSSLSATTLASGRDRLAPIAGRYADDALVIGDTQYVTWSPFEDDRPGFDYTVARTNGQINEDPEARRMTGTAVALPASGGAKPLILITAVDAAGNQSEPTYSREDTAASGPVVALTYQCTTPGGGAFPVRLRTVTNVPAQIGTRGKSIPFKAALEFTEAGQPAFAALGAASVSGTFKGTTALQGAGPDASFEVDGTMGSRSVADAEGWFMLGRAEWFATRTEPGDAQLTFGSLALSLAPKGSSGAAIEVGSASDSDGDAKTFDSACTLSPSTQDTALGTTEFFEPPATPTPVPTPLQTPVRSPGLPTPTPTVKPTPVPTPMVPAPTPTATPVPTRTPAPTPTATPVPAEEVIPYAYALAGSATLKTLTKGSLPLTGSIFAKLGLPSGTFTGDLTLNPATGNLTALGFLPVVAKVNLVPTDQVTGTLKDGKLTAVAKVRIKLPSVKTLGIELAGGANCQAKQISSITLSSTQSTFKPLSGGPIAGSFSISDLSGCGFLTGIVSPLTKGTGNAIALNLTPTPLR